MTPRIVLSDPTGSLIIMPTSGMTPQLRRYQVFSPHGAGPAAQAQAERLLQTLLTNPAAAQDAQRLYQERGLSHLSPHDLIAHLRQDLTDGIFIAAYYIATPALVPVTTAQTSDTATLLADPPGAPVQWSATQRIAAMLRRIPGHVPAAMRDQVAALFTPEAIAVLAIFLAALAVAQFYGVGELVDAFLAGVAWAVAGFSGVVALGHFVGAIIDSARAKTVSEIDRAATSAAGAIVTLGIAFLTAILLRARAEQKMSSAKPPEPEPEPEPRTKQTIMRQNAAQGKAFEQKGLAYLKTQQNDVEDQVSIRPYNDDGTLANYRVRVDAVGTDDDGTYHLTDFKSSDTAGFTPNQTTGYPLLEKNGGVVVGGDAYPAGTQIPPTAVDVLTPNDIP
jgi:hypothetical protein